MSKTKILIVEDEAIVAKDIENTLRKIGYDVVGVATSAEKAIQKIEENKPSLVLMDIMLKGKMNGIEAAEIVRKQYDIPVIFLTAYADENTLEKAKVTEPYGYIIKPYKEVDLHTSIEMALYKHKKRKDLEKEMDILYSIVENKQASMGFLFVKSNSALVKINTADIFFVEALKDYVIINTRDAKYTIHSTMKDIESKLPSDQFMRVHRSYIIRLDKIAFIESSNIVMEGNKKIIPIGGNYKEDLMKRVKTL
ncbi:MAG: response regulator [Candidatus Jordarchaeaceae archaeon]